MQRQGYPNVKHRLAPLHDNLPVVPSRLARSRLRQHQVHLPDFTTPHQRQFAVQPPPYPGTTWQVKALVLTIIFQLPFPGCRDKALANLARPRRRKDTLDTTIIAEMKLQ